MTRINEQQLMVPVNGAQLFCRVYGNKRHPLIVIPGGPGIGQSYLLPQMAKLGEFSHVIFYDQRGTGHSTGNDNSWQSNPFKTYINDINELRIAFNIETVSLLAHSWGGILASHYALSYPNHVDKIIYANSTPLSSAAYLEYVKHRSQLVDKDKEKLTALRESTSFLEGDPTIVEQVFRIHFSHYFAKPEQANRLTFSMSRDAAKNSFKIYDLFYDDTNRHPFDLYQSLNALNKPTLIVACEKDIIPLYYTERLHQSISSSTLAFIKESGHFPYIEQPVIFFKTIKEFIERKP